MTKEDIIKLIIACKKKGWKISIKGTPVQNGIEKMNGSVLPDKSA